MFRIFASLLAVFALLTTARANIPFQEAGADKKPAQVPPADARQKIIKELNADGDNATDLLADRETRDALAKQQRIIDNLTELLKQQDPAPKSNANQTPSPQPMGQNDPSTKPKPSPADPKPQPAQPKPQPQPQSAKPEVKPAPAQPQQAADSNKRGEPGDKLEKQQAGSDYGKWELPRRLPPGIDALARDRFLDRYEELLRAYYRNIAESNRRNDD